MYLSIYRYRVQELTADQVRDGQQMRIHRQAADEDGTQSGQAARTDTARAGHDEHTEWR